jgi:SAM-dependent methyltransferase
MDEDARRLRAKWDARYRKAERIPEPARVLSENLHLLAPSGSALDLACGLGENALLLAGQGLEVHAWDLSPVAIARLEAEAQRRGLGVTAEVRDVRTRPPGPASFDVITVAHFFDRDLAPAIAAALRPRGLLFYQTLTREAVSDRGPGNPDLRLAPNELLRLFPGLLVRFYREEGRLGDLSKGTRDLALLVAERPPFRGSESG